MSTIPVNSAGVPINPTSVIDVDSGGGGDYTSVATAAAAAVSGQTIVINPGTYTETSLITIPDGVNVYQMPGAVVQTSTLAVLMRVGSGCRIASFGQWKNTRNHAAGGIAVTPASSDTTGLVIDGGYWYGTAWAFYCDSNYKLGTGATIRNAEFEAVVSGLVDGASYGAIRLAASGDNIALSGLVARASRPSGSGTVTAVTGVFRSVNTTYTNRIDYSGIRAYASSAVAGTACYAFQNNGVGQGTGTNCSGLSTHTASGTAYGVLETGSTTDQHNMRWSSSDFEATSGGTSVGIYCRSNGQLNGGDTKEFINCFAKGGTWDIDADMTTGAAESAGSKIWFYNCQYDTFKAPTTGTSTGVKRRESRKLINVLSSDVGNVGAGEDDLHSYTTPAATLVLDGDVLEAEFTIALANHITDTARVRAYFAGTSLIDTGAITPSASLSQAVKVRLQRVTSTTARVHVSVISPTTTANNVCKQAYTALTGLDWTTTNIIKITGEVGGGANNNSMVSKHAEFWVSPSPT